jgi:hypothetical protein
MNKKRGLLDEYQFPGFRSMPDIQGIFGDPKARIIRLKRVQKKRCAATAAPYTIAIMTRRYGRYETYLVETSAYTLKWKFDGLNANVARR